MSSRGRTYAALARVDEAIHRTIEAIAQNTDDDRIVALCESLNTLETGRSLLRDAATRHSSSTVL